MNSFADIFELMKENLPITDTAKKLLGNGLAGGISQPVTVPHDKSVEGVVVIAVGQSAFQLLRHIHIVLKLGYGVAELNLVDDVQFFSGKKESQTELFHTFNELHQKNKQIILTSDRPPFVTF